MLSMMLQPISPRLSGEFGTHVDISCAAAVFVVKSESTANTPTDRVPQHAIGSSPPLPFGLCEPSPRGCEPS